MFNKRKYMEKEGVIVRRREESIRLRRKKR
jgi:hypothetical protein